MHNSIYKIILCKIRNDFVKFNVSFISVVSYNTLGKFNEFIAQSAGAVEYTNCTSAEAEVQLAKTRPSQQ